MPQGAERAATHKYRISTKQATNPTGDPGPVPAGRTGNRKESQ